MTRGQLEAEDVDVERGQTAVQKILNGHANQPEPEHATVSAYSCAVCHQPLAYIGRNRLSNCGHMRRSGGAWVLRDAKPEPTATPGVLNDEQVLQLEKLTDAVIRSARNLHSASREHDDATEGLHNYLNRLQGK